MQKSDEIKILDKLPELDYSNLPKDIEETITRKPYVVENVAKLTWDGKQFLVRIPSEISNEMNLTIDNKILFKLIKPMPDSDDKPELKIELL
jgi:hypothetical protein